jgi:hypothetical protein
MLTHDLVPRAITAFTCSIERRTGRRSHKNEAIERGIPQFKSRRLHALPNRGTPGRHRRKRSKVRGMALLPLISCCGSRRGPELVARRLKPSALR